MLFNSIEFLFFLPLVFFLYWFVFNKKVLNQNVLVLISSYVFYGWWDYRFLSLIFLSTLVDYFIGLNIPKKHSDRSKKFLLIISISFNLIILGFFKYFNFFIDSWISLFNSIGYNFNSTWSLNIILPVGISFYTFQTMSYTIDIYKKKLSPTKDFISFASFVSFFPQLVAGPIERATNLIPQMLKKRKFNYIQGSQGIKLIIWGMFKKIVVADSLAPVVDEIFINYNDLSGGVLLIGAIYFAFQIYCDFSGYSDIAIGTAKLFGFELMSNFKFPYFSRNIGEFWRRWHISLSTWFRDYLYIPLGGSKVGKLKSIRNVFIIFLVSGFWHGSNWTFIFWGLFHSILFLPSFIFKTNRTYVSSVIAEKNLIPSFKEFVQVFSTFILVTIGWVFFRSDTISNSFSFLNKIIVDFSMPKQFISYFLYVIIFVFFDYLFRKNERDILSFKNVYVNRLFSYFLLFLIIIHLGNLGNNDFIYFQF